MIISSEEIQSCRTGQRETRINGWVDKLGEASGLVVRVWDPGALKISVLQPGEQKF